MKRSIKIALLAIATTAILLVIGFGALGYLLSDTCGNDSVAEYVSPDAAAKLVVFQRDCGATTGFSTQASLLETAARLPNRGGNLFVADTDHGTAPSGPGGGPELHVRWESPKGLLLQYHAKARVFKAEHRVKGIEVRYETLRDVPNVR